MNLVPLSSVAPGDRSCGFSAAWRLRLHNAGVAHLRMQRKADISNLGNLLLYSLGALEEITAEKGGIRQLLDEKWRKVYRANAPRELFTQREMHAA